MEEMKFSFEDSPMLHKITVFGIGGGGNNAINNMVKAGIQGAEFVAANSDLQDLDRCQAPNKVQVGKKLTKGQGCGGLAERGKAAAMEDVERIQEALKDSDMVFITAGMGGGTGSGGAPVVAEALSRTGHPPLIVGVVTKPFSFEGARRMKQAQEAIKELTAHCHSIITVPNEKLMGMMPKGGRLSITEAYRLADEVLLNAVKGITDLVTGHGLINVDFQDLTTVMTKRGPTIMGVGQASGDDRAIKATQAAISSPLLDDLSIKGAKGVLINITGPEDIGLDEVAAICNIVTNEADPEGDIFHGLVIDPALNGEGCVKVTVIATGLGQIEDAIALTDPAEAEAEAEAPKAERRVAQPGVLNYAGNVERQPAMPHQSGGGMGSRSIRRNPNRYETMQLDDALMDIPTYMRVKAD